MLFSSLQTARLIIRPFDLSENLNVYDWFYDPDVMGQTFSGVDSVSGVRRRIKRYHQHQIRYGVSKWLVTIKDSSEPIGDAGLIKLDNCQDFDIGFRLKKVHWRKGYGTEIISSWIDLAFGSLGLERLYAHANPENLASVSILKKFLFESQGMTTMYGSRVERFILKKII